MIGPKELLDESKKLVKRLVADMRISIAANEHLAASVDAEYAKALSANRTGLSKLDWVEGWIAQGAVGWVLGCVFVRFCEDNGLVDEPRLSGPGNRLALAKDHRSAYLVSNPAHDDRHWLRHVFTAYAALPGTSGIFGPANPVWLLAPTADGGREITEFWWTLAADRNEVRFEFTDPDLTTRFLGDLYQDLSDHAKKTFALLQTPIFVEEFILDRTLDPAVETFGVAEVRLIDPTCGSGHFLLGAFDRLVARWREAAPGTSDREIARRALDAIAGVDLNPFAASIARFRLLVSALKVSGSRRLADAPDFPIHVAVGDSLRHGELETELPGINVDHLVAEHHSYSSEDVAEARRLLTQQYHAVVGNPPYIVVKDKAVNELYRRRFKTCKGKYSLGVPFTEKFWTLAVRGDGLDKAQAGYVGLITANSFMKREMGSKLIEEWLPHRDLTHVIDTSGAYIPGHGTPTVILLGRNRLPVLDTVRTVMGIRGEPSRPTDAAKGLVWSSIMELVDRPGEQSAYVSVTDLQRTLLGKHPWSIGGGGASELKELLHATTTRLEDLIKSIGFVGISGFDDIALRETAAFQRNLVEQHTVQPLVSGDQVRDWGCSTKISAYFPYRDGELLELEGMTNAIRTLWPHRTMLRNRPTFSGRTYADEGRPWWEWHQINQDRLKTPLSIVFAFVATHNHFVLDRGGKVFKQSAPVIKLPAGSNEDAHLPLLGLLNSSTFGMLMRFGAPDKGNGGIGGGIASEDWERFFMFNGSLLEKMPVPTSLETPYGQLLDGLATALAAVSPESLCAAQPPTATILTDAHERCNTIRAQMISAQEELDWHVYRLYGLVDEDLTYPIEQLPDLALGERAFEIVLARKMADGEEDTTWFKRHGSTPITELPEHWPDGYRALVQRRIDLIESDLNIGLIEKPEYKRRWNTASWETQEHDALRSWLLDRLESDRYWGTPEVTTVGRLAGQARRDGEFVRVAALYQHVDDLDLVALIDELVREEAVPYLAALRFTESGLAKHEEWQKVWRLQREEDATGATLDIGVPPKYNNKDFQGVAWTHRGKLDVPKERFISYPGAEREGDASLVIAWAGWDHLERARALAAHFIEAEAAGRPAETVLWPMLAGLAELVPWIVQWHNEPNAELGGERAGAWFRSFVDTSARRHGTTPVDLVNARPVVARTRKPRKKS